MSGSPEPRHKDSLERPLPKRFYDAVAVAQEETGFGLRLDGRSVRTPMRHRLDMPARALAEAVAAEWDAQTEVINPARMPLTRLANTALDRVEPDPARIVEEIVEYAGTDLLCYRAEAPEGLVERQNAAWDPLLRWAAQELGARLAATVGIMHQPQPEGSLQRVRERLAGTDSFALAAIHNATTLTGSAIIALALEAEAVSTEDAWAAAHVDEDWQIDQWGRDAEAAARRARRHEEFAAAARLLALLRENPA